MSRFQTDPKGWQRLEQLFHEAQALSPDKRDAFLMQACAGDESMRQELQSLLGTPVTAEGFLNVPALAAAVALGESALTGRRIGVYHVQERIGVGGMGEVYRARDTRLGRDVAIKILPELFTADPDRLARFGREARVLAALNHPNIATIHGFEESEVSGPAEAGRHVRGLVMELVEGETLAERIAQGPIPVLEEAIPIAKQIAEALEAAHEKGIIHRDLKPANVKVRPDGTVKVLDFGLAKVVADDGAESQAPTATLGGTREGAILGTAAYMSPEQARGQAVDKRTDIWAFGCVLYEMFTGKRAFEADRVADTVAAIVRGEPEWRALPANAPASVRALLIRCLDKDSRRRLRDIGEARVALENATAGDVGDRCNDNA